ncbi:GNAT family N-acetyltransferase [Cognatilysobacter tabacisoli]|uniref:hypothetical protein n=1 Tax=Cognatilysobacter tabacisoli TaxID=2315424 RepID=UPI000E6AEEC4|nr:hypothetical protein [Lysobacter tabacisoli]
MNAAAPPPTYSIHEGNALLDRSSVLAIWDGSLGQAERMRAKYDWFYLHAPGGPPLMQLLRHEPDESWVGTCAAGRRRMLWRGREIQAGVLVDLAVSAAHRSLGPALMLQQRLIAAARSELDVLYGFPNPKAAPVFKRIGYRPFGDLVRFARVLRHRRYLELRLPPWLAAPAGALLDAAFALRDGVRRWTGPALRSRWSAEADPRMDTLWNASAPEDALTAVRDARHVRWRFDHAPIATTRHLLVTDRDDRHLLAWFATQVEGDALLVRDFWSEDASAAVGMHYVDALLQAARKAGHASVSVEIAARESRLATWRARGFVLRSRRTVFGMQRDEADHPIAHDDLYLTAADEDE